MALRERRWTHEIVVSWCFTPSQSVGRIAIKAFLDKDIVDLDKDTDGGSTSHTAVFGYHDGH